MIAAGRNSLSSSAPGSRISSLFLRLPLVIAQMIGSSRAGVSPVT